MSLFQEDSGLPGEDPGISDARVLDEFHVPFGAWMDQTVDWIDTRMEWALDAIKWPFDFLLTNLVRDFLEVRSWLWVVLLMFAIGWLFRGLRVGLFALVALSFCGILGPNYWVETARTIGFIGVAVLLCVVIGIPVGIACGRLDSVWAVVRPVLDAMQVVHSFVYMLPFIYFFGIGEESATMVTMVFALPPLVRLTNLGIRQVPEDVVEASRAYGAPEFRVLTDVQIPLARPAIMTGVNQTLLLAISMLGIAAIMGAGGLGRLMFQALSTQDVARGAAAGLAFFLVAVTLDRISQPADSSAKSLLSRIHAAWMNRRDPESLLQDAESIAQEQAEAENYGGHPAPVAAREGLGLKAALVGAVIAFVSVFLTWGSDSSVLTGHARSADIDLAGLSFDGLDARGGSMAGYFVLIASAFIIVAAIARMKRPSSGRYLSADGITIAAFFGMGSALTYLWASPVPTAPAYSNGIGAYLAMIGMLIAVVAGVIACSDAPYAPHRPVAQTIEWHKLIGAAMAIVVIGVGTISGWAFDQRDESVVSEEDNATIDELRAEAEENPALESANAMQIAAIVNSARRLDKIVHDGFNDDGVDLGWLAIILGGAAGASVLFSAGVFGSEQHRKWRWSVLTVGLGIATSCVGAVWIATIARTGNSPYNTGIGAFLVIVGGAFLVSTGRGIVSEFFRTEVFDDELSIDTSTTTRADQPVEAGV